MAPEYDQLHRLTDEERKQVLRDLRERGRDIEGVIKQWFTFVKPNFHKYVDPQRNVAGTATFQSIRIDSSFYDDPNLMHSSTEHH